MKTFETRQQIILFRQDLTKCVNIRRTVSNIHFEKDVGFLGEITYKGLIVWVSEVRDDVWEGKHPIMTKRERARMLMEEDR